MTREVTLAEDARVFQKTNYNSKQLCRTGECLRAGSKIKISEPEILVYDHRDQEAVSFVFNDKTYYLLKSELMTLELVN